MRLALLAFDTLYSGTAVIKVAFRRLKTHASGSQLGVPCRINGGLKTHMELPMVTR